MPLDASSMSDLTVQVQVVTYVLQFNNPDIFGDYFARLVLPYPDDTSVDSAYWDDTVTAFADSFTASHSGWTLTSATKDYEDLSNDFGSTWSPIESESNESE